MRLVRIQAVALVEIAGTRIAHHLDGEIRLERLAFIILAGPRARDADQAMIEQQRVRGALALRQAGAVRAIAGGEQRVLRAAPLPLTLDGFDGEAHCVSRLVAGDASAPVGSLGSEEGMTLRLHRAVFQQQAQGPIGVRIFELSREGAALIGVPPRIFLGGLRRCHGDRQQGGGQRQGNCLDHQTSRTHAAVTALPRCPHPRLRGD